MTITDVQAPVRIWRAEGSSWIWWCRVGMCMYQVDSSISQIEALNHALEHLAINHSEPTA
jgi:hypothetical protein